MESLKRAEYYIALRTGMDHHSRVLDVGCGVGGPLRNIATFTGADITGVTLNEYQVRVGNQYCHQQNMSHHCRIVQGDFQHLDLIKFPTQMMNHQQQLISNENGTVNNGHSNGSDHSTLFDIAFAIEATCHSPDRVQCFTGIQKLLKPGGYFAGYEWIVLPEHGFDANNPRHVQIKEGIEVGNGLPTLATASDIISALEQAGFEVLDSFDANRNVHDAHEIPWYQTLDGSFTLSGFRMTRLGRICTHALVTTLEWLRIAPKGTVRVSALLNATAIDLVDGGKQEIFTPSFFFLAQKKHSL
jgi:sterol 24-C-methyltransferase